MKGEPTIFHFNCPVCGAHPKKQYLVSFLELWKVYPKSKIESLISLFCQLLKEISGANLSWKTKQFSIALNDELELLSSLTTLTEKSKYKNLITKNGNGKTITLFDCPLCETPAGKRPEDRYFTKWACACKVQIANVLYEVGIILYVVMKALPVWADSKYLVVLTNILKANRKTQEAIGLPECPLCGRFTTGLYGTGTEDNPCRCRWCLDRGGGGGIGIRITLDEDMRVTVDGNKPVCPISEEIVPFRKPLKEDPRPPLTIDISLPSPPDPNQPEEVLFFWQNLLSNNKNIIRTAFNHSLNLLLTQGIIKRFKDMSAQSSYWSHPSNLSVQDIPLNEFSLIDFIKEGFYQIGYAAFEVVLSHDGSFKAPSQILPDSESSFD